MSYRRALIGLGAPGFVNTKSLLFDGVDERIECGKILTINNVSAFSYSFWMKLNDTNDRRILGAATNGSKQTVVNVFSSTILFSVSNGGLAYGYNGTTLGTGTWYHVACVFDGTLTGNANRAKVYLNGGSGNTIFFRYNTIHNSFYGRCC